MKKLLTLVLAVALVLTLCSAAFAEGYSGPVLVIAGTEDDTVDPRWSARIVEASLHPMSRTCFIEGMDHTFNVFAEEDLHSLRRAVDATGAFFVLTLVN